MAKAKKRKNNPELKSIYNQIASCNQKIKLLKKEISDVKQVSQNLKDLSAKVSETEATYRRKNASQMLKLNLGYKAHKEKIFELKNKLGHSTLEHLIQQLSIETRKFSSLTEDLKLIETKLEKISLLQQLEKKFLKKTKSTTTARTVEREKSDMPKKKQKVVARVERFKSSSGGSSTALTSRSSTWTVKKK